MDIVATLRLFNVDYRWLGQTLYLEIGRDTREVEKKKKKKKKQQQNYNFLVLNCPQDDHTLRDVYLNGRNRGCRVSNAAAWFVGCPADCSVGCCYLFDVLLLGMQQRCPCVMSIT